MALNMLSSFFSQGLRVRAPPDPRPSDTNLFIRMHLAYRYYLILEVLGPNRA